MAPAASRPIDLLEALQGISGILRVLIGVEAEEALEDGEVWRRIAWRDPCVYCGEEVIRHVWTRLRFGLPARVRLVEEKLVTTCSGCARDLWHLRRRRQ